MIKLNLLPPPEREKLRQNKSLRFLFRTCLALTGIFLSYFVLLLVLWFFIGAEAKIFQQELESAENLFERSSLRSLQEQILRINKKTEAALEIQQNQLYFSKLVEEVSALTPAQIKLTSVSIAKGGKETKAEETLFLVVQGFSPKREFFQAFQKSLEDSDFFLKIESPLSNFLSQTDLTFRLEAEINREKIKL